MAIFDNRNLRSALVALFIIAMVISPALISTSEASRNILQSGNKIHDLAMTSQSIFLFATIACIHISR